MPTRKLAIPNDWEEDDEWTVVLFCIPNSRGWRGTISGLVSSLGHGRTWDKTTGSLITARDTGREIFESLKMNCFDELAVDVKRIAEALESMEEKIPELVSLQDILDNPELYFAAEILDSISPLLEIASFLVAFFPEIKVDPFNVVKWITAMIRHAQIVAALMSITAAISTLAAAQGTQTLVSLLTGGIDAMFKTGAALVSLRDDLIGVATSFWSEPVDEIDTFDEIDYTLQWHSQNVILTDIADSLRHANQISQDGMDCLCATQGGQVLPSDGVEVVCGIAPAEFEDWDDFYNYRVGATHWALMQFLAVINAPNGLYSVAMNIALVYWGMDGEQRYAQRGSFLHQFAKVTETYFTEYQSAFWLGNNTQGELAERTSLIVDFYGQVLDDIVVAPSKQAAVDYINAVFVDATTAALTAIRDAFDDLGQAIWGERTSSGAENEFQSRVQFALDNSGLPVALGTKYNTYLAYALTGFPDWVNVATYTKSSVFASMPPPPNWIDTSSEMGCAS